MKRKLKSRAARGKIVIKMISSSVRIVELSGLKQESDRLGGVTACSFHRAALPALHCNRAYCSALHCTGLHCIAQLHGALYWFPMHCNVIHCNNMQCTDLLLISSLYCTVSDGGSWEGEVGRGERPPGGNGEVICRIYLLGLLRTRASWSFSLFLFLCICISARFIF